MLIPNAKKLIIHTQDLSAHELNVYFMPLLMKSDLMLQKFNASIQAPNFLLNQIKENAMQIPQF